jgi:hypothetical protein
MKGIPSSGSEVATWEVIFDEGESSIWARMVKARTIALTEDHMRLRE